MNAYQVRDVHLDPNSTSTVNQDSILLLIRPKNVSHVLQVTIVSKVISRTTLLKTLTTLAMANISAHRDIIVRKARKVNVHEVHIIPDHMQLT